MIFTYISYLQSVQVCNLSGNDAYIPVFRRDHPAFLYLDISPLDIKIQRHARMKESTAWTTGRMIIQ
jgi:hypothetical protein